MTIDTSIMRGLSKAEFDTEFTLDSIPDMPRLVARRAAAGEEGFAQFEALRDIRYGARPEETLHLFPAKNSVGAAPLHIFIHGGFWRSMEAAQFGFLARGFVPFGAALALIDYPLIPAVRLSDIVASCRAAIAWAYHHGSEYGLDRERIFISGNSAGGHLVAEMLDRAMDISSRLPADAIKGGTAISGIYDLAPVAASFQNDILQLTDEEVATFSPLHREVDIKAPVIATVGGNETNEFLRQTADFADALRAKGSRRHAHGRAGRRSHHHRPRRSCRSACRSQQGRSPPDEDRLTTTTITFYRFARQSCHARLRDCKRRRGLREQVERDRAREKLAASAGLPEAFRVPLAPALPRASPSWRRPAHCSRCRAKKPGPN